MTARTETVSDCLAAITPAFVIFVWSTFWATFLYLCLLNVLFRVSVELYFFFFLVLLLERFVNSTC